MDPFALRTYVCFVPEHPQNTQRLVGSKWTCHALEPGDDRPTHYEVVDYSSTTGECQLRSVRLLREKTIPWRQLRQRKLWTPGWRSGVVV
ncbi:MAG: hypothetical protein ACI9KE_005625 [Polyangiales bacterium]|jgi:hypothetical protein